MQTAKALIRLGECPGWFFAGRTGHFLGFVVRWLIWEKTMFIRSSQFSKCMINASQMSNSIDKDTCLRRVGGGTCTQICTMISKLMTMCFLFQVTWQAITMCINLLPLLLDYNCISWAPSSEFVSSSIPSWQILTAYAQPFRRARDLAFCLKVPLDSLLVWASSGGSGETARMRRLAWTFAARIGDKYQIRLTRSSSYIWAVSGMSKEILALSG